MSKHHHQRTHFGSFLLHFRPRAVPERTLRFTLSWGLGGMAMVLVLLLIGTGLMLKFVYQPFPDRAYDSIVYLNSQVPFGQLLRNIHWWSANALILITFLHLLRVFYTGAFVAPRQLNWAIGLLLVEMQKYGEAAEYLARAAKGLPERPRIHYNLGLLYQHLGNAQNAESELGSALTLQPESLDYQYALVEHYLKRGLFEKARPIAEAVARMHPENPVGAQILGYIRQNTGQ